VRRAEIALGHPWRWLRPVAGRFVESFSGKARPRHTEVVAFLRGDRGFRSAWERHGEKIAIRSWITGPQPMQPAVAASGWNIPRIESKAELAAWLNLTVGELDWYADVKGINRKQSDPRLMHYHLTVLTKESKKFRLIEAPKQHLRHIQRRILAHILDRIPAHPAAHGFVKGRSIKSFAAPHVGRAVVLRMDLEDFFPSYPARRIQAFFRTIGYPESVADLLGGMCTNSVHFASWKAPAFQVDRDSFNDARRLYSRPHLPQGAPTSPALANLCFYRLDCRLAGLAKSAGAIYTRYADDLAFSGNRDFAARAERFSTSVASILLGSGFSVNHHKTRVMRKGVRQHLAGLVTNERLNVPREEVDRLRAILTNCIRHGAQGQNRIDHPDFRSHLAGRIGFVESIHPAKGVRLRKLFEQVRW
jgi:retron-type reverse transcriptase